jgi:hypothetical protein
MQRLVFPESVNDHTRPEVPGVSRRMWRIYAYAESALVVFLWKDGRTEVVETMYQDTFLTVDGWAFHGTTFEDTDWQVPVLTNAGFTLEVVT